jgi:hypothetical protein
MQAIVRTIFVVGFSLSVLVSPYAAQASSLFPASNSVVTAIDAAIQSLQQQPNQFHLTVNSVGMQVTNNGGTGPGLVVQATGGGPGSTTTGLVVNAGGQQQVNIAAADLADAGLRQEAEKAIQLLTEIKSLLQKPKVDKPAVAARLSDLSHSYVAPILSAMLEALVNSQVGPLK